MASYGGRRVSRIAALLLAAKGLATPLCIPSMTLEEAVQVALGNSPDIQKEESSRDAARQVVRAARALHYPRVNLSVSYADGRSVFELPAFGATGPTGKSALSRADIANPFRTQVTASAPLYTGGELSGRLYQSRASLRAADRTVETRRREVILRVREAFYGALKASALFDAATSAVNRSREAYRTTYRLAEAGLRSKADLLRSEVAMAAAEREFLLAADAQEWSRSLFNDALARDLDAPVDLTPPTGEPQELTVSVNDEVDRALRNRPDLLAHREQASGLDGMVRASRSALLPGVALSATYGVVDSRPGASPDRASWTIGGGLNWTVFDGMVNMSRYREALHTREGARRAVQTLERRIALEVRQAYLGVREAFDRMGLADRRVRSAREGYRVVDAGYREGKASQADLLGAQADLAGAEAEVASARYDHLTAWARLRFAVGADETAGP